LSQVLRPGLNIFGQRYRALNSPAGMTEWVYRRWVNL